MSEREPFSDLQRPNAYWAAMETVLITAALPIFGLWLRPTDPFFLHADFPWLVLAPLLPALRYGFVYGFGSALGLVLLIALGWRAHWLSTAYFPGDFVLGLLVVGAIAITIMSTIGGNISFFIAGLVAAIIALKDRSTQKKAKPTTFGSAEWADLEHLIKHGLVGSKEQPLGGE